MDDSGFGEAIKKSFDINGQIVKIINFTDMIMRQFIEMIGKIIKYTKLLLFGSFRYSKLVILIFTIIFVAIILFSKNRFGALVVLVYFLMAFITLYFIALFILLLFYIIELIRENIEYWKQLSKDLNGDNPPKVTGGMIWQIFKHILIIIFIVFLIFVLGFVSYFIKIAAIIQNVLFDSANSLLNSNTAKAVGAMTIPGMPGMPGMPSIGNPINAADSFGGILRKILEKCS